MARARVSRLLSLLRRWSARVRRGLRHAAGGSLTREGLWRAATRRALPAGDARPRSSSLRCTPDVLVCTLGITSRCVRRCNVGALSSRRSPSVAPFCTRRGRAPRCNARQRAWRVARRRDGVPLTRAHFREARVARPPRPRHRNVGRCAGDARLPALRRQERPRVPACWGLTSCRWRP